MVNNDRYIDLDVLESDDTRDAIHQLGMRLPEIMSNEHFTAEEKQSYTDVFASMKTAYERRDILTNIDVLKCLEGASLAQAEAVKRSSHVDVASSVLKTKSSDIAYYNLPSPVKEPPTLPENQSSDEKLYAS
jgi:hypothetical protein